MTTVEPPSGLDLEPIRQRSEAHCPPAGPKALWTVAASAADVPDLIAEVEALRSENARLHEARRQLEVVAKAGVWRDRVPGPVLAGYELDLVDAVDRYRSQSSSGPAAHAYLSTACHHGQHPDCRITCKFCPAMCRCPQCGHAEPEVGGDG